MMIDQATIDILKGADLGMLGQETFVQPATRFYKWTGFWLWKKAHYLLAKDYAVKWFSALGVEKMVIKRAPYDYDKASVPQWGLFLGHYSYGASEAASLFHDDGYEKEGEDKNGRFEYWVRVDGGPWKRDASKWSRAELDDLYRMICVMSQQMSELDARVEWASVRAYPPNLLKPF